MIPRDLFSRIEELFHRALDRDESERGAFLDRECPDPSLRAAVEQLLEDDRAGGSFAALRDARDCSEEVAGASLGGFRLVRILGEGGMGTVWEAEQLLPVRRRVALKLIRFGMDTREVVARFEMERQTLALMEHPGIARVFDAGAAASGRPYFAMELVRGEPLLPYCDDRRLDTSARIRLFVRMCHAVQHAHQKGVIHRDLKPSNVLVQEIDGTAAPKIIDFGVAKAIDPPSAGNRLETRLGRPIGTPDYMSPEQARGDPNGLDTRSDVFSLGVILYELLTGFLPHERGATPEDTLRAVSGSDSPRPSRRVASGGTSIEVSRRRGTDPVGLVRRLRGDLDWIVLKALEKDRERRYGSASDLAADLERHLRHEPVRAGPPGSAYRMKKFVHRHRLAMALAATALAALLTGLAGVSYGLIHSLRAERQGKSRLHESLVEQIRSGRHGHRLGHRVEALAAAAEAAVLIRELDLGPEAFRELRDLAIAAMVRPDVREVHRVPTLGAAGTACALDATHSRYAVGEGTGGISIRRVDDGQETIRLEEPGSRIGILAFSPDGGALLVTNAGPAGTRLAVWDLETKEKRCEISDPKYVATPCFVPDGRSIALGHSDGTVRLFEWPSCAETRRLTVGGEPRVRCLPGGTVATWAAGDDWLRLQNPGDGRAEVVRPPAYSGESITAVAEHPSGRYFAVALGPRILVWDRARGAEAPQVLPGVRSTVSDLAFHPERGLLLSSGYDTVWRAWDARSGRELFHASGYAAFFSRDGSRIAFQEGAYTVVAAWLESLELRTLRDGSDPAIPWTPWIAFDPGGRLLATTRKHGVTLWDVVEGRERIALPMESPVSTLFDSRGLLAANGSDLLFWTLERDEPARALRVGIPRRLSLPAEASPGGMSSTPDGRVRAIVLDPRAGTVRVEEPDTGRTVLLRGHPGVVWPALSPDGSLAATGPWNGRSVLLWDARTGDRLGEVEGPRITRSRVLFSPDGGWLATSTDRMEINLWSVGDWRRGASIAEPERGLGELPAPIAFSPDGSLLARADPYKGEVHLLDVASGLTRRATLGLPGHSMVNQVAFSPDGRFLALGDTTPQIHVWDLPALRRSLAGIGLDFE